MSNHFNSMQHLPFDAVIMLTWSDWKTEPRSNRYHYASRFARHVPVLFVQPWGAPGSGMRAEPSDIKNLTLLHGPSLYDHAAIADFHAYLRAHGIMRPLLWIYDSLHYQPLLESFPKAFRVYHATEDYFTPSISWNDTHNTIRQSIEQLLPTVDLLVAVSQGVHDVYRQAGYAGPAVVAENGCDADFFMALRPEMPPSPPAKPIAIFQGGINARLDYPLLLSVCRALPEWEFQFYGRAIESDGWKALQALANVRYFGAQEPELFGRAMHAATVGLIPYIQDQWIRNSLPLKAYEYLACDLPVVSVPIDALAKEPDLFTFASTAEAFATALQNAAASRHDAARIAQRRMQALANSYDARFEAVLSTVNAAMHAPTKANTSLHVAMLYDATGSMHVSTIREHLEAFERYSHHRLHYIPADRGFWQCTAEELQASVNLHAFDAVIMHYSVRLSICEHLQPGFAEALADYRGVKILFIQDEYEGTETARQWMEQIGFDIVYTCVPSESLPIVYPQQRFPHTRFLPTLTGYVPESTHLEAYALPMHARQLHLGYRGRALPAIYGQLGQEKYEIGVRMKALAAQQGIPADIEVTAEHRIYGDTWYRFLGSCRATLGTESGANIFDFDGSIQRALTAYQKRHPHADFSELHRAVLAPHDGKIRMNQISPKIFEAIRLRTALVLFEGSYSGVIRPHEHYLPLAKDFSNAEEILAALDDLASLEAMTERAYRDVIASGNYSYERFVKGVDAELACGVRHSTSPVFFQQGLLQLKNGQLVPVLPCLPLGLYAGPHPNGRPLQSHRPIGVSNGLVATIKAPVPAPIRRRIMLLLNHVLRWLRRQILRQPLLHAAARLLWRQLPYAWRLNLARYL